jgi:hypothetical protein
MTHSCIVSARWLLFVLSGFVGLGCESSGADQREANSRPGNVNTGIGMVSGAAGTSSAPGASNPDTGASPLEGAPNGANGEREQNVADVPLSPPDSAGTTTGMGTPIGAAGTGSDGGSSGAAPASPACPATTTAPAGERTESLMVGGQNRSYL